MSIYYQMTDKELLGILIGERKGEFVADRLMEEFSTLPELLVNSVEDELLRVKGIGSLRAKQIKACYELARRLQVNRAVSAQAIKSPGDAADYVMFDMRYLKKEVFKIMLLNTKNHVLSVEDVSVGSLSASIVHPREVYTNAVRKSASGIIALHNHPSGDATPSKEDVETTKRLQQAGEIVGIKFLDHIVIGDGTFVSLKEQGYI